MATLIESRLNQFKNTALPWDAKWKRVASTLFALFKLLPQQIKTYTGEPIKYSVYTERPNTVRAGAFTALDNINYLDGFSTVIDEIASLTGSLIFYDKDLNERSDQRAKTFVGSMRNHANYVMDSMLQKLSLMLQHGYFAKGTAVGTATGIKVDKAYAFQVGQEVIIVSDKQSPTIPPKKLYVAKVNLNDSTVGFSETRAKALKRDANGAPAPELFSLVAYVAGSDPTFYTATADITTGADNAAKNETVRGQQFYNLRKFFLPGGEEGGDDILYNTIRKDDSIVTNPLTEDGQHTQTYSGAVGNRHLLRQIVVAEKNLVVKGVDFVRNATMSMEWMAIAKDILENIKGKDNQYRGTTVVDRNAWAEIWLHGVSDRVVKLTAAREWNDDMINFIDWATFNLFTEGDLRLITSPDGNRFTQVRDTAGTYHAYIMDLYIHGQLLCHYPMGNATLHSMPETQKLKLGA